MRAWIVNRVKGMSLPSTFGSPPRVYSDVESPARPFILVRMGVESSVLGMPAEARVQTVPFAIQIHTAPGSYVPIDEVAVQIKNELATEVGFKIGNLSVFRIKWEDIGQDGFDDHFATNVRPVRFTAMTRSSAG